LYCKAAKRMNKRIKMMLNNFILKLVFCVQNMRNLFSSNLNITNRQK
jgi:hypothetical protein